MSDNRIKWSKSQIQFLIENYSLFGPVYCANKLNKTSHSIKHKAIRLKLKVSSTTLRWIKYCGNKNLFDNLNISYAHGSDAYDQSSALPLYTSHHFHDQ